MNCNVLHCTKKPKDQERNGIMLYFIITKLVHELPQKYISVYNLWKKLWKCLLLLSSGKYSSTGSCCAPICNSCPNFHMGKKKYLKKNKFLEGQKDILKSQKLKITLKIARFPSFYSACLRFSFNFWFKSKQLKIFPSGKSLSVITITHLICLRCYLRQIVRWGGQIPIFTVPKLFNGYNYLSGLPKILLVLLELGRL